MKQINNITLSGLYAIADSALLADNIIHSTIACLRGGARLVQFRDKTSDSMQRQQTALELRGICHQFNAKLIVNDDVKLAQQSGADGVHLGKNDQSLSEARTLLGDTAIIGVSCYNQLKLAKNAEKMGANYVAFGSLFPSPTKPEAVHASLDLVETAKAELNLPVCVIGGINLSNADRACSAGADMLAVISGLFAQANIENTARQFTHIIETQHQNTGPSI